MTDHTDNMTEELNETAAALDTELDTDQDEESLENVQAIPDQDDDDDEDSQSADDFEFEPHAGVEVPDAQQGTAEQDPLGTVSRFGKEKKRRWYIVHTYSGHENKVKVNLERRIESMNMAEKIFRVEVPQKPVTKIKDGKRVERDERVFPGYVLVEMIMDDDSWYVVRYTPGVTKFVGGDKKPIPAKDAEIKRILFKGQQKVVKVEVDLKAGQIIRITSGPFADFEGTVTEVNADKEKLKATVSIFGRETPVELVFSQVEKIS